jgi:hypothetical protein
MVEASKRWQRGEGSGFGRGRGRGNGRGGRGRILQTLAELTSTPGLED